MYEWEIRPKMTAEEKKEAKRLQAQQLSDDLIKDREFFKVWMETNRGIVHTFLWFTGIMFWLWVGEEVLNFFWHLLTGQKLF